MTFESALRVARVLHSSASRPRAPDTDGKTDVTTATILVVANAAPTATADTLTVAEETAGAV